MTDWIDELGTCLTEMRTHESGSRKWKTAYAHARILLWNHARELIDAYLERDELRDMLRMLGWSVPDNDDNDRRCPWCWGTTSADEQRHEDHEPGCRLAEMIGP